MGCYKKRNYSSVNPNNVDIKEMARRGNESIKDLMFKDVAVKKRRSN